MYLCGHSLTPIQGSAQNLSRGGKKSQNFLYFCMLTPFSIEKEVAKMAGRWSVPTSVGRALE